MNHGKCHDGDDHDLAEFVYLLTETKLKDAWLKPARICSKCGGVFVVPRVDGQPKTEGTYLT